MLKKSSVIIIFLLGFAYSQGKTKMKCLRKKRNRLKLSGVIILSINPD
jgi:hypothetical protein